MKLLYAVLLLLTGLLPAAAVRADVTLPGLQAPAQVRTDEKGVRHLVARNDLDLARLAGWVHARDRFFQMDVTRRQVDGTLAELLGPNRIPGDIQGRTVGLHRAAQRSFDALAPEDAAILQAYADGVNHWLQTNPLPPEYAQLELTQARPWTPVDSLSIGKAIAASLSLDLDTGITSRYERFVGVGDASGFDGAALFADVVRVAPMDPASTVPDATGSVPFVAKQQAPLPRRMLARAAAASRRVNQRVRELPWLARSLERTELPLGSNEWGVAAEHSVDGRPMIANDPHLSLNMPSTFYEWHLTVEKDPARGRMNVSGVGFPGVPGVILGQTERVTWGATTNPMDVTDVFEDELHVFDPACNAVGSFACIRSEGVFHPVRIRFVSYRANQIGDGVLDNVSTVPLGLDQSIVATVPFRSFGPLIDIEDPGVLAAGGVTTALVLQYTGFHATREVQTFLTWNRAQNLADFRRGLADFDVGSQNWAYADADGNLAYFASAENPLRADLEQGRVHGLPPFFVRDGSGPANWVPDPQHSQGQAIPFAVLPEEEMPHVVNPARGFFANANNDPAGTSLDDEPLNQGRPGRPSAIYYLNGGYGNGLRAGRITRLIRDRIESGHKISAIEMRRWQGDNRQLDAELMVPFLLAAFERARGSEVAELHGLARDAKLAEAIHRLAAWDFSTPTGIPEGWDKRFPFGRKKRVGRAEARASVAATLYNVWRGQLIRSTVDARLAQLGLPGIGSGDALRLVHHLLSAQPYTGRGERSGVDLLPEPAHLAPEDRRDLALLQALRDTLDLLASDAFAPAFANATELDAYRWGKLHRITFDHELGGSFSLPPAAGFQDLSPQLPGLARDGGYEVVNASGFSARATGAQGFRFGGGPVRRYVGVAGLRAYPGLVRGWNVMPGGPSGDPASPLYATQLRDWLLIDHHPVRMKAPRSATLERFTP